MNHLSRYARIVGDLVSRGWEFWFERNLRRERGKMGWREGSYLTVRHIRSMMGLSDMMFPGGHDRTNKTTSPSENGLSITNNRSPIETFVKQSEADVAPGVGPTRSVFSFRMFQRKTTVLTCAIPFLQVKERQNPCLDQRSSAGGN